MRTAAGSWRHRLRNHLSKLTYGAVSPSAGSAAARPIAFHTAFFLDPPAFRLYRLRCGNDDGEAGFMTVDALPERVNVRRYEHFVGLR